MLSNLKNINQYRAPNSLTCISNVLKGNQGNTSLAGGAGLAGGGAGLLGGAGLSTAATGADR